MNSLVTGKGQHPFPLPPSPPPPWLPIPPSTGQAAIQSTSRPLPDGTHISQQIFPRKSFIQFSFSIHTIFHQHCQMESPRSWPDIQFISNYGKYTWNKLSLPAVCLPFHSVTPGTYQVLGTYYMYILEHTVCLYWIIKFRWKTAKSGLQFVLFFFNFGLKTKKKPWQKMIFAGVYLGPQFV